MWHVCGLDAGRERSESGAGRRRGRHSLFVPGLKEDQKNKACTEGSFSESILSSAALMQILRVAEACTTI